MGFTPLALPWQITGVIYLGFTPLGLGFTPLALLWVYPFDWAKPGVYPPDHPGFTPQMAPPHVSRQRGKPSNRFNNEFDSGGHGNCISGRYLGFAPLGSIGFRVFGLGPPVAFSAPPCDLHKLYFPLRPAKPGQALPR